MTSEEMARYTGPYLPDRIGSAMAAKRLTDTGRLKKDQTSGG